MRQAPCSVFSPVPFGLAERGVRADCERGSRGAGMALGICEAGGSCEEDEPDGDAGAAAGRGELGKEVFGKCRRVMRGVIPSVFPSKLSALLEVRVPVGDIIPPETGLTWG